MKDEEKIEYTFWNFKNTELFQSLKEKLTPPSTLSTHHYNSPHIKDHISHLLRNGMFYETHTLLQFYDNIPKEGMILDIGANIGNHQIMFNQLYPNRPIFGFEASPLNYFHLHKNTKKYPNTSNVCVGLGEEKSLKYITHFHENMGGSSVSGMAKPDMTPQDQFPVLIEPLDIMAFDSPITFIKVDVEGFELNVFKGAYNTLKKHKPVIWVEDFEYIKNYDNSAVKYLIDEFKYNIINNSECNYLLK